jgi:hypothetical protein
MKGGLIKLAAKKKGFNEYKIIGDTTIIYIINKKGKVFEAFIDTEDLQKLIDLDYCWGVGYRTRIKGYYVCRTQYFKDSNNKRKSKTIVLHRLLVNAGDDDYVDHKDHNGLNNRKTNIVATTNAKNLQNRIRANDNNNTGHLNVSYIDRVKQYWVQIMKDGVRYKWTFPFDQFEEACQFAANKREELFGS